MNAELSFANIYEFHRTNRYQVSQKDSGPPKCAIEVNRQFWNSVNTDKDLVKAFFQFISCNIQNVISLL
jgi:hypothetical protein